MWGNSTMKHLFIPYDFAMKLRKVGFNEPCLGYYTIKPTVGRVKLIYNSKKEGLWFNHNKIDSRCSVPLYQQVIDWFRIKYDMHISVESFADNTFQAIVYSDRFTEETSSEEDDSRENTYYGALLDGLNHTYQTLFTLSEKQISEIKSKLVGGVISIF